MSIYEKLNLKNVINASGKMTTLGVSTIDETVGENMKKAGMSFVKINDLINKAGKKIAEYTGAEDACVTVGASAGIAISTAACIAKDDLSKIEQLPFSQGLNNEVILQKGHAINFGAPITQMISLGGGVPVEVGSSNQVKPSHIEQAINKKTAALLYVKSHHSVQKGMVSIEDMLEIAAEHNLPLILDGAAEEEFKRYISLGVDLVIYSGSKALEGPTSGFITGKENLISYCKLQYEGIGRAMKIGKENIMGLLKAIQIYFNKNRKKEIRDQKTKMKKLATKIDKLKGLVASVIQDEAGREIYRTQIKVNPNILGINAFDLIEKLKNGNPAIYTRNHYANLNIINIDPRPLNEGEIDIIFDRLTEIVKKLKKED
mgnify:CR=1 FL=1